VKIHEKYGGRFSDDGQTRASIKSYSAFKKALEEAGLLKTRELSEDVTGKIHKILEREPELLKQFLEFIPTIEKPDIDLIAVTYGPGLEPALWVGINFAHALSAVLGHSTCR
jgi:tRNA A37 threonylcarbamoyladenosine modification protein TsaB